MTGDSFVLSDELRQATSRLRGAEIESAATDARLLIAAAARLSREEMLRDPDLELGPEEKIRADAMIRRRAQREPVSRILGRREFRSLDFEITSATLDPRADSESIVEAAIDCAQRMGGKPSILDVGTGTGCLLLSVLHTLPDATGIGADIDPDAIAVARRNAKSLGCDTRAAFQTGDWLSGIMGGFDIVISNPPYIPTGDITNLAPEVSRYDPRAALDGGSDGLDAYRILSDRIPGVLSPSGIALFEIGTGQADAVTALFLADGWLPLGSRADLAGHTRCLSFGREGVPKWFAESSKKGLETA